MLSYSLLCSQQEQPILLLPDCSTHELSHPPLCQSLSAHASCGFQRQGFFSRFSILLSSISTCWPPIGSVQQEVTWQLNWKNQNLHIPSPAIHRKIQKGGARPRVRVKVLVTQSCLNLYDPVDCSLLGSSVGFSRQERWSALPFPSPGDLPDPGSKPRSPVGGFFSV